MMRNNSPIEWREGQSSNNKQFKVIYSKDLLFEKKWQENHTTRYRFYIYEWKYERFGHILNIWGVPMKNYFLYDVERKTIRQFLTIEEAQQFAQSII